jgi:hypothetical protein
MNTPSLHSPVRFGGWFSVPHVTIPSGGSSKALDEFALGNALQSLETALQKDKTGLKADQVCFVLKHKTGFEVVVEDPYDQIIQDRLHSGTEPTRHVLKRLGGAYAQQPLDIVKQEGLPKIDRALRNSLWYTVQVAWKVMYGMPTQQMQADLKDMIQQTRIMLDELPPAELAVFEKGSP